ncbi:diguanylate cyclase [Ketobacter sp. MCCC 1A13808]|uniref:sensor domain-containing diguanylate cyclase n=1 Tax=Ketobacter sp. MCCC 1A13808 TaxID=2602738 RepID=UPI000F2BAF2C|nr:sensor domain-containing diguanylate cyclase [Ketobacter sp. MCCC 1A13808]MVF10554.1 diguanylate cyclase [Ketobacter sp. MCCC 1A13808]RLP55982.1 MAG: sensor domain-containing diguanylate cyclase [Ketobacter sp.]
MMEFRKLRIKTKLIVVVLLTSTIGLLFTGMGVLTLDRIKQKEILAEEMSILVQVIASRSAAALSFRDQARAKDNLTSLLVRQSVEFACMYNSVNQIFAQVARGSETDADCPPEPKKAGEYFILGYLDAYQKIELNDLEIGTVMVRTSLIDLDRRLQSQILMSIVILSVSLVTAFLITQRLQRAIYQPIVDLGDVASKITEHNNFSIRASTTNEDEIGETIAAFNAMLNKIEADNEELTRLAYYDPLTKLANRRMFSERLLFALENARRSGERMGLIFLDLDKFKEVNDELGHDIGDLMLKAAAKRLEAALPLNATAFRLGGDEFTVLQVGVSEAELEITAQGILNGFAEPLILAGRQLVISSSIGIAMSDGNDNVSSIVKSADVALYQAKDAGRANYKIYKGG